MNTIGKLSAELSQAQRELDEARKNPPPTRKITGVRTAPRYKTHVVASEKQEKVWQLSEQLQQAYVDRVANEVELAINKDDGKYFAVVWDNAQTTPSGVSTKYHVSPSNFRSELRAIMEGRWDLRCDFQIIEEPKPTTDKPQQPYAAE